MFEINNDLRHVGYHYHHLNGRLQFDYRYIWRVIAAITLTIIAWVGHVRIQVVWSPIVSGYMVMTAINVLNGFRPWHYLFKENEKPKWYNYIRRKMIYGRKMSMQYLIIWDPIGCIIGGMIIFISGML